MKVKALTPVRFGEAPKGQKTVAGPGGFPVGDPPATVRDLKVGETFDIEDEATVLDLVMTGAVEVASKGDLERLVEKAGHNVLFETKTQDTEFAAAADTPPPANRPEDEGSQMAKLHRELKARLSGETKPDKSDETPDERRQRTTFEPSDEKKGAKKADEGKTGDKK